MVKATAIIQARMSSTRLPGKVMMQICDKPVIYHIIERLKVCNNLDGIILATSTLPDDDVLESTATYNEIQCYRGSLDDVLGRYHYAAQGQSNCIIRVCADSPLLDSKLVDTAIEYYYSKDADIVNIKNMPLGLGAEVFSYTALERAYDLADEPYQRENVTPYMYENLIVKHLELERDYSHYRLTLDTKEDFEVIQEIYKKLYKGKHNFFCEEIIRVLEENPEIAEINKNIEQKQI